MIQPKYEVGQRVWVVDIRTDDKRETCPDCLGTKHWPITTPGGDTFDLECATCRYGYEVRGFLTTRVVNTVATQVTIGSVRIDTERDCPIEYMMIETGVGSGRVWKETDVFATEADAYPRLEQKRAEIQAEHDAREAARVAYNKKNYHKPSYEQRRIRELEKEVRRLVKESK